MPRILSKIVLLCVAITSASCGGLNETNRTSQTANPVASPTATNETSEQKAVRLAEHFIIINGYTTAEPDMNNLTPESFPLFGVEKRRNTLQPKAYGLAREHSWRKPGWTVVFLYTKQYAGSRVTEIGRAVTMDENFENLRVEHEDFLLKDVEVKF